MSWLSDGLAYFVDALADAAGEAVTLSRANDSTEITAIATSSMAQVSWKPLPVSNYWERDWMVKKADYAILDVVVTPQTGDRITDSSGDIWELMIAGKQPELVQHAGGYAWVVKTKRIVSG